MAVATLCTSVVAPAGAQEGGGDPSAGPGANVPQTTRITRPKKPPPVNLVVTVGQENVVRNGVTVPVHVVLDNTGDAVKGDLELRDMRGKVTRMPYELPRGAHKEYTLFAPMTVDVGSEIGASAELLVFGGRKELARAVLTPTYPDVPVLISCTGDGAGLQFLSDQRAFRVSHRAPKDMPREWAAFRPASVVAVNGRAWTEMDEQQRRSLRTWVEQGGRAILCGELTTEWRDPDGLSIAGIVPREMASLPALPSLAPWSGRPFRTRAGTVLTLSGPLQPGARVLFREGQQPVVVARRCLEGRVIWLGFDAFRETFRAWEGFENFWRRAVVAARAEGEAGRGVHSLDEVDDARAAAAALPRLPVPPLPAIIGFGVAYALIFGPLNIWMLRRLRRTVKAWLFTPALAVGMTFIALVAGQSWGSARTVLNSVSVIHAAAGSRTASEESLIGLFSPTNRAFDLTVDDSAPTFEDLGGVDPQEGPGPGLGWPDQQADGESSWNAVALQLFSVRRLQLRRPIDLSGVFEANLRRSVKGGKLGFGGTVRNGTSLTLKTAYLWYSGRYYWVGDLAPGQQLTVNSKGWSEKLLEQVGNGARPGGLLENQRFQDRFRQLWSSAGDSLLPDSARDGLWLVARVQDHAGGLQVSDVPYSNRAALVLLRCDP